jgi:phosphoenolpyruvate carboxylase
MRDNTLEDLAVYRKATDKPSDVIRVVFKTGYMGNRTRSLSSSEMLFSLRDIGTSSIEFLKNWIQIHPNARSVIDNLVDPPTGTKVRLTQRFFNLVQAAEVYHRLFHSTQSELSKAEHDKRLSEILNDVRDAHKDWLKQILAYSNELRLAARLTAILTETETIVRNLLPSTTNRFTSKIARTRNDLTHRLTTAVKSEDLFVMSEVLFLVLAACLLMRAGLAEDKVAAIITNNFRYGRALENRGVLR